MGEHVHLKISLSQPDAFSALINWTVHSKRGEIKCHHCAEMPCGADVIYFLTVHFSSGYGYFTNLSI